ncbi:hypothetical protein WDV91_07270 [Curtobacterium flaccumfaciens pv. flaccumfaciens]|jgi:hypothetical protein|uniref:hypothetical protein n=1 Tax=Curtobacterium flaccumfaciens TaxID=2035 RepID=UPI003245E97B
MTKPDRKDVYGAIVYGVVGIASVSVGSATHEAVLNAVGAGLIISAVPAWLGLRPWLRGRKRKTVSASKQQV